MPKTFEDQEVEYVDFSEGQYKVSIAIDRSYQTKQEEALAGMNALAETAPPLVPMYADLWVRAMGFSGSNEIADRLKAQNPAAQSDKDQKNLPPAAQAQLQALKMQHEQAMGALKEAQQLIETDGIKMAGQKEIAAMKAAAAEQLEQIKQQGKRMQIADEQRGDVTIETVKGRIEADIETLKGQIESMQQQAEQQHEVLLAALDRRAERERARESAQLDDAAADYQSQRQETAADRQARREEVANRRQAGRDDTAAGRAATRADQSADRQAGRDETSASQQALRDQEVAERQAERDRLEASSDGQA